MKPVTNRKKEDFIEIIKRKAREYLPPSPEILERQAIIELLEELLDDSIGNAEGEIAIRHSAGKIIAFENRIIRTQRISLKGAHNE